MILSHVRYVFPLFLCCTWSAPAARRHGQLATSLDSGDSSADDIQKTVRAKPFKFRTDSTGGSTPPKSDKTADRRERSAVRRGPEELLGFAGTTADGPENRVVVPPWCERE